METQAKKASLGQGIGCHREEPVACRYGTHGTLTKLISDSVLSMEKGELIEQIYL